MVFPTGPEMISSQNRSGDDGSTVPSASMPVGVDL